MADGLEVVAAGLLIAIVSVDAGVSGRTRQVLAISEGYVLPVRALEALSEAEVDDIDGQFGGLRSTNQKVIGLDVPVDDTLLMHYSDPINHLYGHMEY